MDSSSLFLYNHNVLIQIESFVRRSPSLKYLCVFDMDGTLLNTDQSVSARNRDALKALKARGVGIVLATGRTELMTRLYVQDLELELPVISNNGSLVIDTITREILYRDSFSLPTLTKLIEYGISKDKDYFIYTIDKVFYSANSRKIEIFHTYNRLAPADKQIQTVKLPGSVDKVLSILPNGGERSALKVLLSYQEQEDCDYFEQMQEVEGSASQSNAFDITPAGCTKGKALKFLAAHLGVERDNIFAFGDNCNDLSMLEYAGYAVVPGNAIEEAKAVADFIALPNDEAGIAQGIFEFVIPRIS